MPVNNSPAIGLIPARGGSKGVLKKNTREVAGRPLVEFTIEAALNSSYLDEVYLSSDDDQILAIGREKGVLPIKRPAEFATDTSASEAVVKHFLTKLPENMVVQNPYIVYLQPTSPLRTAHHIDKALACMQDQGANTLVSVVEMLKSPFKSFTLNDDLKLQSLFDEKLSNTRRQDLPIVYLPNGAIYVFRISDFVERSGFPSDGSLPLIMSEAESLDIDSEEDIMCLREILGEEHG
jgi:CMP-N,N'-diacetyllegionaminic acid synthase